VRYCRAFSVAPWGGNCHKFVVGTAQIPPFSMAFWGFNDIIKLGGEAASNKAFHHLCCEFQ
jgi:hypothetical protein